jgi:hypothetical protein
VKTVEAFRASLSTSLPPAGLTPALQALWWAGRDDWTRAHNVVQQHEGDATCDWVHAHLHHQEGDMSNAGYWYRRAGRPVSQASVELEWEELVRALL